MNTYHHCITSTYILDINFTQEMVSFCLDYLETTVNFQLNTEHVFAKRPIRIVDIQ